MELHDRNRFGAIPAIALNADPEIGAGAMTRCTSTPKTCEWCSVETLSGNHGGIAECVVALEHEVSRLRAVLREREQSERGRAAHDARTATWKFRTA